MLILKDCLSTSGIHRDLFVPCLSKIFEGPYRSWYLVNKKLWRTWREFARAFRYEWGVKKDDADLLLEVHELKLEKNETLAEFACRARLIFERMQYPPEFKERLKQILTKFNPRLTFEILNLSLKSYTELLHYVNERSYLYQRSVESQQMRPRSNRADLSYVQDQFDSADEPDEYLIHDELKSSDENIESEQAADFNVFQPKRTVNSKKEFKVSNSKSLTRQRLDQNLDKFQGKLNQADITSKISAKIPVDERTKPEGTKPPFDRSKLFCFNCAKLGHTLRYCTPEPQMVCCLCCETGHFNMSCSKYQGNAKSSQ